MFLIICTPHNTRRADEQCTPYYNIKHHTIRNIMYPVTGNDDNVLFFLIRQMN